MPDQRKDRLTPKYVEQGDRDIKRNTDLEGGDRMRSGKR